MERVAHPAELLGPAVPPRGDLLRVAARQRHDEHGAVDRCGRRGTRLPHAGEAGAVGADRGRPEVGGGVVEQRAPLTGGDVDDHQRRAAAAVPFGHLPLGDHRRAIRGDRERAEGPGRCRGEVAPGDHAVGGHGAREQPFLVRAEIAVPVPHGVRGVQHRADLPGLAGRAPGRVVLVGDGAGERLRPDDDGARGAGDHRWPDPARPAAHDVGLARGREPPERRRGVVGGLRLVGVGAGRGEEQVAVGEERLPGLPGAPREPAGGPLARRVDLPQRGAEAGALRVGRGDRGDQPGAVRRHGQARQPGEVLEGLQVAPRGHGMSTSLPVVRRAWRSSCAARASSRA